MVVPGRGRELAGGGAERRLGMGMVGAHGARGAHSTYREEGDEMTAGGVRPGRGEGCAVRRAGVTPR